MDDKIIGLAILTALAYLIYSKGQTPAAQNAAISTQEGSGVMDRTTAESGTPPPSQSSQPLVPQYYTPHEPTSYYAEYGYGQSSRMMQQAHDFARWVDSIQVGYPQQIGVIEVGGGAAGTAIGERFGPVPLRVL